MQGSCCLANQGHSSASRATESELTTQSFTNLKSDSIVEQLISQFTNKRLTLGSQQRREHVLILPCKILLTHSTKGVYFLADMQPSLVFNYQCKWQTSIDGAWASLFPSQICRAALIWFIIAYWCTTLNAQRGFPKHGSRGCRMWGYLSTIKHWPYWTWNSILQKGGDGKAWRKRENHHPWKQAAGADRTRQTGENN